MFAKTWQVYLAISAIGVAMAFMVVQLGPWVFSEPISAIGEHELSNVPPPADARSFAVSHGRAVYFTDGPATAHPFKLAMIVGSFLLLWTSSILLYLRLRQLKREPAAEG